MLKASIDIGSNTILLLVANLGEDGLEELENHSLVTSLGKGLDRHKVFSEQAIEDSFKAFKEYAKIIKKYEIDPKEVIVTATEASRVAQNSRLFFEKVEKKFGFQVQVITPEGEAYYAALGVVENSQVKGREELVIMDIGGASTEFIKVRLRPFQVKKMVSLPMGSVRCTNWREEGHFDKRVEDFLSTDELEDYETDYLLCIAGSMTSLGGMIKGLSAFDSQSINGACIDFSQFEKFVSQIIELNPETLLRQYPFLGKRSYSISTGALLGLAIGRRLGVESFEISTLGLRYGTIREDKVREDFLEKPL